MKKIEGGVTAAQGFEAASAAAGIKYKGRTDMALVFSKEPCVCAGTFTTNVVKAAPVLIDMEHVKNPVTRAMVINSGNANACTGQQGIADGHATAEKLAGLLDIKPEEVSYINAHGTSTPLNDKTETKPAMSLEEIEKLLKHDLPDGDEISKKLILSPLALQILNVNPGDRLSINYIQKNNENTFPVIGKAEIFADPENGQKLTKSNTILMLSLLLFEFFFILHIILCMGLYLASTGILGI